MENIQGMLEEIRGVVHNHFQDENNKIVETMSVLNNLPIVIALRKQVEELTSKNTQLRESLQKYDERENIELEIVELEKTSSLDKKLITDFFEQTDEVSDDEDPEESSSGESEDLTIVRSYAMSLASDVTAAGIADDDGFEGEILQDNLEEMQSIEKVEDIDVSGSNVSET